MNMAKAAVNMAVKHQINLGMNEHGYFIRNPQTQQIVEYSLSPNAQSAIVMMKRFIQKPAKAQYWR